jgi:serine protease
MFRFSTFIVCFFAVFCLYGQVHKNLTVKKRTSSSYLPNTVVFKIKSNYSNTLKAQKENIPGLNKIFKELELVSLKKVFPQHEPPTIKKNKIGQDMVDLSLIYTITFKSEIDIEEAISKLLKTGMVEYAEPKFIDKPLNLPNDPAIQPGAPWGSDQTFYMDRMKAKEAWDICKGDTTVLIGIIDTGTRIDHEDLKNQSRGGWDYADSDNNPDAAGDGHGAFVAGCAAAQTDNGLGIAGTGYNCKFMPVKVAPNSQPHFLVYGYEGIVYAADHNCDVINLSWGGTGSYSKSNQEFINYAVINKNAVVVAAAGNSGLEEDYYPAS